MAIDFPGSPTNGQTFTSGSVTYTYDGTKWTALASGGGATDKIEEGNTSAEVIDTGSDGRFVVTTEGGERARVDSSGRLLVGTSSTVAVGVINSKSQIEFTDYDASQTIKRNTAGDGGPQTIFVKSRGSSNGSNTVVQSGDSMGQFRFYGTDGSAPVEGAAIGAFVDGTPGSNDMPGRLVFSVSQDGSASPTERQRISNNGETVFYGNGSVIAARSNTGAGTGVELLNGYHSATGVTNGTRVIAIYTNGNIQNTNNSYGALSDVKLKENIVDANSQWDDLKALQVRNYNFKEGQTHTQIGLVAQEVELVSPGLVSESPDRDADGNDLGTVTKSVNYSVLYMKAVKALQEAMERIETLEAKVAALEGV